MGGEFYLKKRNLGPKTQDLCKTPSGGILSNKILHCLLCGGGGRLGHDTFWCWGMFGSPPKLSCPPPAKFGTRWCHRGTFLMTRMEQCGQGRAQSSVGASLQVCHNRPFGANPFHCLVSKLATCCGGQACHCTMVGNCPPQRYALRSRFYAVGVQLGGDVNLERRGSFAEPQQPRWQGCRILSALKVSVKTHRSVEAIRQQVGQVRMLCKGFIRHGGCGADGYPKGNQSTLTQLQGCFGWFALLSSRAAN